MGISFVNKAIVPDVKMDEYETDDSDEGDRNVPDELPVNGKHIAMYGSCEVNQRMMFVTYSSYSLSRYVQDTTSQIQYIADSVKASGK